jgi:hypothetical protein
MNHCQGQLPEKIRQVASGKYEKVNWWENREGSQPNQSEGGARLRSHLKGRDT